MYSCYTMFSPFKLLSDIVCNTYSTKHVSMQKVFEWWHQTKARVKQGRVWIPSPVNTCYCHRDDSAVTFSCSVFLLKNSLAQHGLNLFLLLTQNQQHFTLQWLCRRFTSVFSSFLLRFSCTACNSRMLPQYMLFPSMFLCEMLFWIGSVLMQLILIFQSCV